MVQAHSDPAHCIAVCFPSRMPKNSTAHWLRQNTPGESLIVCFLSHSSLQLVFFRTYHPVTKKPIKWCNSYLLITLCSDLESAKAQKFIKLKIEKHMLADLRDAHACLASMHAKCFAVGTSHFSSIFFSALRDIQFIFFCFYISNRFFTDIRFCSLIGETQVTGGCITVSVGWTNCCKCALIRVKIFLVWKSGVIRKWKFRNTTWDIHPKEALEREKHIDLNINNTHLS